MTERRPPHEELRHRRQAARLSYNDCERALGISISMLSRIEGGHRRPGIKIALILDRAFKIPVADWVTKREWEEVDIFKAGWRERYDARRSPDQLEELRRNHDKYPRKENK